MGPRLFSRGNGALGGEAGTDGVCFNGAATLQSRKFAAVDLDDLILVMLSMGPRLFSRGNRSAGLRGASS